MEQYRNKHESGLVATLDYDDIETARKCNEPIYIHKDIMTFDFHEENNITMSVSEAKWLINELNRLVSLLEVDETDE